MTTKITETDWRVLRGMRDELLETLCGSINCKADSILKDSKITGHARYLKLYRHMQDSDDIVAECFNDWRRSRMGQILLSLKRHKLLKEEHFQKLTEGARDFTRNFKNF